jgi:RNA polymerase primary sigma factor
MSRHDAMKCYMDDIGHIPLVTREEECILAKLIQSGDMEAREKLIRANLRLVVKIAHDFKGIGLPLQDLVSEGNIGLMRAAEKFDPEKGAKFSSYAAWWIKQAMRRALSEKSKTIRVPIASVGKINKIRSMRSQLTETLGRDPTDREIADRLDFSERVVSRLRRCDLKTVSLHDPIMRGEDGELKNLIPDDNAPTPFHILDDNESIQRLNLLLQNLDKRERTILLMRYGLDGSPPKTLEQISRKIGRTRERVRQIQKRALNKLRLQIAQDNELQSQFERFGGLLN